MKEKDKKKKPAGRDTRSSLDMPATVGVVYEVREELRADFRSLGHKFDGLEHKFDALGNEFEALGHRFEALSSNLNAKFEEVVAISHRTQVLMEGQRAEDLVVLDGHRNLSDRQDRIESEHEDFKKTLEILAKGRTL